jgi:hypothetical protein
MGAKPGRRSAAYQTYANLYTSCLLLPDTSNARWKHWDMDSFREEPGDSTPLDVSLGC